MTEEEWIACTDRLDLMLDYHWRNMSPRQQRLFGCACLRVGWDQLKDQRARNAVEQAEAFADGMVSKAGMKRVREEVEAVMNEIVPDTERGRTEYCLCEAVRRVATEKQVRNGIVQMDRTLYFSPFRDRCARLPVLLRDISPNPFRPTAIATSWLAWHDGTIPKVARAIYEECAFDRMPILGDALEEAGCDNADILNHCRSQGPHVRGCWLLDLLLAKK